MKPLPSNGWMRHGGLFALDENRLNGDPVTNLFIHQYIDFKTRPHVIVIKLEATKM